MQKWKIQEHMMEYMILYTDFSLKIAGLSRTFDVIGLTWWLIIMPIRAHIYNNTGDSLYEHSFRAVLSQMPLASWYRYIDEAKAISLLFIW